MGFYINTNSKGELLPPLGKVQALVADGAKRITRPSEYKDNLVAVVSNFAFEAAAYAYSEDEMREFLDEKSRPVTWLEYEYAKELAK